MDQELDQSEISSAQGIYATLLAKPLGMQNPSSPLELQRSEASPHGQHIGHLLPWQALGAATSQVFSSAGHPGDF